MDVMTALQWILAFAGAFGILLLIVLVLAVVGAVLGGLLALITGP